jgi:predicted RNase H-related nuclease YkuK (DUF458 family)
MTTKITVPFDYDVSDGLNLRKEFIMKNIIEYVKGILADSSGTPSSKRIISVLFALLIGIGYCANLFYGLKVDDNLLDAVMIVVVAGLGITGVEKFAPRKSDVE